MAARIKTFFDQLKYMPPSPETLFIFKNQHPKFSFIQNKGVDNMIKAFLKNDKNNEFPSMQEIVNITKASFEIDKLIK